MHRSPISGWTFVHSDGRFFRLSHPQGTFQAHDTFEQRRARATKINPDILAVIWVDNPQPIADILDIFSEFLICRLDSNGHPVLGTGRYRIAELKHVRRALLERVGEDAGPARIVVQAEKHADASHDQLIRKEADAALNLERMDGGPVLMVPSPRGRQSTRCRSCIYLNCNRGIFRYPQARLAVNHLVDTVAMAEEVFQVLAVPSSTIVSAFHPGAATADLSLSPTIGTGAKASGEGRHRWNYQTTYACRSGRLRSVSLSRLRSKWRDCKLR